MKLHLFKEDVEPLSLIALRRTPMVICGCDPGPDFCAFVALKVDEDYKVSCVGATYLDNLCIETMTRGRLSLAGIVEQEKIDVFAYEKVSNQGRIVGKQVFETCAMSGSLRRHARHDLKVGAILSFTPSDWRWITVGFGNAKDSETRSALAEMEIEGLEENIKHASKVARSFHEKLKPCNTHMRDAAGVALATLLLPRKIGADELMSRVVYKV